MKYFIVALVAFAVVLTANSAALPDEFYQGDLSVENSDNIESIDDELVPLTRDRRFSCDLFSFSSKWVTPNHAVCAARCISELHKGGSCVNGRCQCRKKWWQG